MISIMLSKGLIFIVLVFSTYGIEDNDLLLDTEVQFSYPETSKSLEQNKNSTILITQETERDVMHPINMPEEPEKDNEAVNTTVEEKKIKVECAPRVIPEDEVPKVVMANSSTLLNILTPPTANNASTNECVVVLFYSPQCVFSAKMAPHYNALARVYPNISFYAVNAMDYGNLHVRYGLVYVPNVMLFHNTKPIARFNETTMTLDTFVIFINKFTGLEHNETSLNVTSVDMIGPVPAVLTRKVDYVLILAWMFTIACMCFGFVRSSFCRRFVDLIKNTWQEAAAAQHEHED